MKTAMQELLTYILVDCRNESGTIQFNAHETFNKFLEKEKEQSIEFAMFMYEAVSQKNGVPNNLIQSSKRVFESQFDKRFNQNK